MSRTPLRLLTALATTTLATGALLLSVATTSTATTDDPVSGDERATAFPGNIKMGDCAAAGLSGSAVEVESTDDGVFIDITSVPEGVTITGVVVKGGEAYNVYAGDVRDDLHAPLNPNGEPAGISHWFVCGTGTGVTTTTSATTSSGSTSSETTSTETSDTSVSDTSDATATSTSSAVSGGGLADTGFSARVPLTIAGLLILVGAGLLAATRRQAFRRG